ncbi:creatininase [Nocardiopsis gilva YIM 90087]|uniref:Creatininase n=1 Tax=Nocardiopsis gilva YIM 90087 TaxID=1235441 RepID=A0A223S1U2_9ACTN|nr:creatininase family protein [Nocardiopsis gilva]ASU82037.1 creatininase [Nocardiopsis gilva YIM 90087]
MDGRSSYLLPLDTSPEAERHQGGVVLLPIGSFEQHGPYLPSSTDTVIACTIANEIAVVHRLQVLPPVTVSCSHEHEAWPGTVSISAQTLIAVVRDIAASVRRSGAAGLVLVNAHGGNYALGNVVQEARGSMALFPGPHDWQAARDAAGLQTSIDADMHAGELETSILLHAHPELVRAGYASGDSVADERPHLLTLGLEAYTSSGVVGRPSLASAAKGAAVLASLVESFAAYPPLFSASP